jgi:hypothetical protein
MKNYRSLTGVPIKLTMDKESMSLKGYLPSASNIEYPISVSMVVKKESGYGMEKSVITSRSEYELLLNRYLEEEFRFVTIGKLKLDNMYSYIYDLNKEVKYFNKLAHTYLEEMTETLLKSGFDTKLFSLESYKAAKKSIDELKERIIDFMQNIPRKFVPVCTNSGNINIKYFEFDILQKNVYCHLPLASDIEYPIEIYFTRYDIYGSSVYECDIAKNMLEYIEIVKQILNGPYTLTQIGECILSNSKDFLYNLKVKLNRMDEIVKSILSKLGSIVSKLNDEVFRYSLNDILGDKVYDLQYAINNIKNYFMFNTFYTADYRIEK